MSWNFDMRAETCPGDMVSIALLPFGRHEGIVGRDFHIISRSRRYSGVVSLPPSVFADGQLRENHGYIGRLTREETLARAEALLGDMHYDVINNNCVHFVNEVNGLPREARMRNNLVQRPSLSDLASRLFPARW